MKMALQKTSLADRVMALIESARQKTVTAINVAMVYTYYEIGRQIVEEEQGGRKRAGYGDRVIAELSRRLAARYGRGWSPRTLASMKSFYLIYSERVICKRRLQNRRDV